MALCESLALFILGAALLIFLQRRQRYAHWRDIDPSILKNGASAKKLAACGDADYVIVGSGLGGLTSAALLSRAGFKCVVLEQHDVAGGSTHTFTEKGFTFDVGVHYVGSVLDRWWSPVRKLVAVTAPGVEWDEVDEVLDAVVNDVTGESFEVHKDPTKKAAAYASIEAGSAAAVRRYRRCCFLTKLVAFTLLACKLLPRWMMPTWLLGRAWRWAFERSAKDVLARCGLSERVAGACAYIYGTYGEIPSRTPFAMHAMLEQHYDKGGFFPRGGSAVLGLAQVKEINDAGSHVFVRARVDQILLEGNKCVGVSCKGVAIKARCGVISGAGVANTFGRMLPKEVGAPILAKLKGCDPSLGFAYLFIGLDGTAEELGIKNTNLWYMAPGGSSNWDHDIANERVEASAEPFGSTDERPPVVLISPGSAKDSTWNERHPGTATLQMIAAPMPYSWVEKFEGTKPGHRGPEYDAMMDRMEKYLLERYLYRILPQTKGRVVYTSSASPLTFNFFLNAVRGETYALAHSLPRFSVDVQTSVLHPETDVENLFLTGQDVMTAGVVPSMVSGWLTTAYLSKYAILKAVLAWLFA